MERLPCDPTVQSSADCKYFGSCHMDNHHIYRRSNETDIVKHKYSQHLGQVSICRAMHEWIEREEDKIGGPMPFPEPEVMAQELRDTGVHISKRLLKRLKRIEDGNRPN